jgi:ketosteroid isomerase-like protein
MTLNHPQSVLDKIRELESQVDELRSVQQITELQNRYVQDLADRNWTGVAAAYADDAVCDIRMHGVHTGREAIADMFRSELENVVTTRDGYILSSPSIRVNGDEAYGEWTWHRLQCEFRTSFGLLRVWGPWSEGRYKCEYARVDGTWKIKSLWFRVIRPDSDEELSALSTDEVIGGGYVSAERR